MPINPSIALATKGIELQDPLAQYGKIAAIQQAQNQNALAQYQLGAAQRAEQKDIARTNALAQAGADDTAIANALLKSGDLKGYSDFVKSRREAQKAEVDLVDAKLKQSRQFLDTINPADPNAPAQYIAWHQANHKDPILGPALAARGVTADQSMARIQQAIQAGPQAFADLLNQSKLGTEKFMDLNKPHYITENLGGTSKVTAVPGLGGASTVISTTKRTATPGELLVDARARDRLNAEMATGTLTPESLDVAANVYLQTGQLPTGLGKAAAGLRTQVMNRATELSGGKPAADVAGDIVGAKLDVASRGKAIKDFSTGKQGDAVRSFNTAIDHLDTLGKAATALQNGDVRLFNTMGNAIAAATGEPAPTDFDGVRTMVGSEVAKAITGSQMALKDREEVRDSLARANSPAQLAGVVRRVQELMGGQLNSLNLQYETSTGRKDFDKKLTPRAKEVVQSLHGAAQPAGAAPARPAGVGADWTLMTDKNGNKAWVSPDLKSFKEVK